MSWLTRLIKLIGLTELRSRNAEVGIEKQVQTEFRSGKAACNELSRVEGGKGKVALLTAHGERKRFGIN